MQEFLKIVTGHFLPGHENAFRPHLLRKPWLLFFLTIVLTAESIFVASLLAGQSAYHMLSAVLPGEVIALTNVERSNLGGKVLTENAQLALAAQHKAEDMAAKGYFSHTGPDGKEPWGWISEAGYSYRYAGENLAVRFDQSADVVRAWMASPTHRANIVKETYTEIGIGIAEGIYQGQPATFVVQYFGAPPEEVAAAVVSQTVADTNTAREEVSPSKTVAGVQTQTQNTKEVQPIATATAPEMPAPMATQQMPESSSRTEAQTFLRASQASSSSASWILITIASLLAVLTALAVFIHIEIQPGELVAGGALVAGIAGFLWLLNGTAIPSYMAPRAQTASLLESVPSIQIGTGAATELLGDK